MSTTTDEKVYAGAIEIVTCWCGIRHGVPSELRAFQLREHDMGRKFSIYCPHLTRAKNRIANGVCPVPGCKRAGFSNVMRHIASQHPDWHDDHAHDLAGGSPRA